MLSNTRSALLGHAILKFSPEIFFHPVWVRFGKQEVSNLLKIADNLLNAAKKIENDDPIGACQILLACAVYQNHAGRSLHAMKTVQEALDLARGSGLFEEILCAISFQQEDHEKAASQLSDLEVELIEQNEWVLANFVYMVKKSLLLSSRDSSSLREGTFKEWPAADLLKLTFEWLQHWGYFAPSKKPEYFATSKNLVTNATKKTILKQLFFSLRPWQEYWHSLKRKVKKTKDQLSQNSPQAPIITISDYQNIGYPSKVQSPYLKPMVKKEKVLKQAATSISMVVQMLGPFTLSIQDSLIKLSATRGLSLLKYMLLHNNQSTPREILMDVFWPDLNPGAARNNLNVTIYALRKELRSATDEELICYEDSAYHLSRKIKLWLDVEEFEGCINAGKRFETQNQTASAVAEYEIAVNLYQGDFLADNPYDDWTVFDRERLRVTYLDTLNRLSQIYFSQERYAACINLSQLILNHDLCREDAHYRLMQCFSRLGQGPLALRQYQVCVEALQAELEVDPAPDTTQLYEQIRRHEQI